jgi:hypothetical protein
MNAWCDAEILQTLESEMLLKAAKLLTVFMWVLSSLAVNSMLRLSRFDRTCSRFAMRVEKLLRVPVRSGQTA